MALLYPYVPNKGIVSNSTCVICGSALIKNGFQNGKQRLKCKSCGKHLQESYSYKAYDQGTNTLMISLFKEGCGVLSIARILGVSKNTVLKRLLQIGKTIKKPNFFLANGTFQIDEMCVVVKKKEPRFWLVYAMDVASGVVVDLGIGKRNKNTVTPVIASTLSYKPKKIFTDGLNIYPSLIPPNIHTVFKHGTNKIERHNLNIRTHVKRMARKTICYSKSKAHLEAHLKIYFWHGLKSV